MSPSATHTLGPESARLVVRTAREGKAARAGHDLEIEVDSWSATLTLGDAPEQTTVALSADSRSLRVIAGTGGMKALDDDDRQGIRQTIDDDVLKGGEISFHSTKVHAGEGDGHLHVHGELTLLGATRPIAFDLALGDDGQLAAATTIKQTDFGIKPYSALFGTLKVKDELTVSVEGRLPGA